MSKGITAYKGQRTKLAKHLENLLEDTGTVHEDWVILDMGQTGGDNYMSLDWRGGYIEAFAFSGERNNAAMFIKKNVNAVKRDADAIALPDAFVVTGAKVGSGYRRCAKQVQYIIVGKAKTYKSLF